MNFTNIFFILLLYVFSLSLSYLIFSFLLLIYNFKKYYYKMCIWFFLYQNSFITLKRDIIGFSFTFHFVTYLLANGLILILFMIGHPKILLGPFVLHVYEKCKVFPQFQLLLCVFKESQVMNYKSTLHENCILDRSQSLRRSLLSEIGMSIIHQTD